MKAGLLVCTGCRLCYRGALQRGAVGTLSAPSAGRCATVTAAATRTPTRSACCATRRRACATSRPACGAATCWRSAGASARSTARCAPSAPAALPGMTAPSGASACAWVARDAPVCLACAALAGLACVILGAASSVRLHPQSRVRVAMLGRARADGGQQPVGTRAAGAADGGRAARGDAAAGRQEGAPPSALPCRLCVLRETELQVGSAWSGLVGASLPARPVSARRASGRSSAPPADACARQAAAKAHNKRKAEAARAASANHDPHPNPRPLTPARGRRPPRRTTSARPRRPGPRLPPTRRRSARCAPPRASSARPPSPSRTRTWTASMRATSTQVLPGSHSRLQSGPSGALAAFGASPWHAPPPVPPQQSLLGAVTQRRAGGLRDPVPQSVPRQAGASLTPLVPNTSALLRAAEPAVRATLVSAPPPPPPPGARPGAAAGKRRKSQVAAGKARAYVPGRGTANYAFLVCLLRARPRCVARRDRVSAGQGRARTHAAAPAALRPAERPAGRHVHDAGKATASWAAAWVRSGMRLAGQGVLGRQHGPQSACQ